MDTERLQEIKKWYLVFGDDIEDYSTLEQNMISDARELVSAYENQGELLQLALGNVDRLNTALEAAQAELAEAKTDAWEYKVGLTKSINKVKDLKAELEEIKSKAWKTVDLKEGNLLTFVGIHVIAWQQEWGKPTVGFTRWNDDND